MTFLIGKKKKKARFVPGSGRPTCGKFLKSKGTAMWGQSQSLVLGITGHPVPVLQSVTFWKKACSRTCVEVPSRAKGGLKENMLALVAVFRGK